jgi:hypothetical protein
VSDGKIHSKLGASGYERWGVCPGSVAASEGLANVSSIYAEEGTLAHTWAEKFLTGQPLTEEDYLLGGERLDDDDVGDMMDAVQVYLDHVAELRAKKPAFEWVEKEIDLSKYHPELFGTCDYVCYFAETKTLHVVDYKHGRGIPKEPEQSPQLGYYGNGALHMAKVPVEKIVLTIVQPRCFHTRGPVRSWETDPIWMLDFLSQLIDDAKATEQPNAPRVPGKEQCQFCLAAPTCPAAAEQALVVATSGFKDETLAPAGLTPERLAYLLTIIPQIEDWCSSVNKFAHQQAALGVIPPGFKLVDKVARRKWTEDVTKDLLWTRFKLFHEDTVTEKVRSPAQIEKLLKTKEEKFLLDQYVVQQSSGKTLVPDTDKRPATKGAIEAMFDVITS